MTNPVADKLVPTGVELGIYEKALAWPGTWDEFFASAADAGFSFVDLSVDESPQRVARLDWTARERAEVRGAAERHNIALGGLCLSVHRRIAPGSADPALHRQAIDVLIRGIDLCWHLGIPILQLAGYFAYYEQPDEHARSRYVQVLRAGARHAARRGVMLGIENVDGSDVTSISRAMEVVREIKSAWLRLYPDIGNLTERSMDVVSELAAGQGHMLAIHVKDTRPGEPRRVPMGEGSVPWQDAFDELARQRWSGRIMIEMWNDDDPASAVIAADGRRFITEQLARAGIKVISAGTRAPTDVELGGPRG